jgi:putative transposase
MSLYKDKYRIESIRLKGYDYSQPGEYFVTIHTGSTVVYFGNIVNGKMIYNDFGKIAAEEWLKTREMRNNVLLDEWIVMPNHFHGIVCIVDKSLVETHRDVSLQYKNKFGPQRDNLSSIIRGFKSAVTKRIHEIGRSDFAWQPGFYDHIIRNEKELNNIRDYILFNPLKWQEDE